jgi:hypothetical protein
MPKYIHKHYVGLQHVLAVVLTGAYVAADRITHGDSLFSSVAGSTRSAIYVSAAASSGALLGFTITMVTVLITLSGGERMTSLMKRPAFGYVRPVTMGAVHILAVATVVFSVLIVLDTSAQGRPVMAYVATYFAVMAIARVWAVIRLMGRLLKISLSDKADFAADSRSRKGPPPFTEDPDAPVPAD